MHRKPLLKLLENYRKRFPDDSVTDEFIQFVDTHSNCFERSLEEGHVTASAWVVDPANQQALLLHHRKLGLWLQPGGHCDGDTNVARVACKEIEEETGLTQFNMVSGGIFDLDIHLIPVWKEVPAHYHYDVRFLVHADNKCPVMVSAESQDLRWFELTEVKELSPDVSIQRLVDKTYETGNH